MLSKIREIYYKIKNFLAIAWSYIPPYEKCANCGTYMNVDAVDTDLDVKDHRPLCDDCCYKINGYG